MYIDTHTKDTMQESMRNYLGISQMALDEMIFDARFASQEDILFHRDIFDTQMDDYLEHHPPVSKLDGILLFHLGRRLNSALNDNRGLDLQTLLLTDTGLKRYFSAYDVEFQKVDAHIELIYRGLNFPLDKDSSTLASYLRSRLGYSDTTYKDFCFNGYAFKDTIYQTGYARRLFIVLNSLKM